MSSTSPRSVRTRRTRRTRRARTAGHALLCTLLLSACSGTDDTPQGDIQTAATLGPDVPPQRGDAEQGGGAGSAVTRYGQIMVSETTGEQGGSTSRVAARFVGLGAEATPLTALTERVADTCHRVPDELPLPGRPGDADAPPAGGELPLGAELLTGELDAGQAIVLSGPSGTWSTLLPDETGDYRVYLNETDGSRIDGRVPSGLVVDIPDGGGFPGFAAIALPDPQPGADSFVPALDSRVDATTEYRWAANGATGSRVHLALRDADGRLDCFASDDGFFTLAEADSTGQGTGTLTGAATLAGVAREATRIERQGDATLVLTVATERP